MHAASQYVGLPHTVQDECIFLVEVDGVTWHWKAPCKAWGI